MDVKITDDLFHVSFGTLRQVGKDFKVYQSHQNHPYSPIWTSEIGRPLQLAWELQDGVMINQHFHGCEDH